MDKGLLLLDLAVPDEVTRRILKDCALDGGDILLYVAVAGDGDMFLFVPAFDRALYVLEVFL